MSFNSRSISDGFKGQLDRLKATRISTAEIAEKMKRLKTSEFTEKMKRGVDQVTNYAKTVAEKIPEKYSSSKGTVTLDSRGFEVYNIDDSEQIYVAKISDKAVFSDETDSVIVTMAEPDKFVGTLEDKAEASVVEEKPEVDVGSLFSNVNRGRSKEVHAVTGMYVNGAIEEVEYQPDYVDGAIEKYETGIDTIVIMPAKEEEPAEDVPVFTSVSALQKIEAEPLTVSEEQTAMIGSADPFINSMVETAMTDSGAEALKCNPMEDEAYSKDALTPVREKRDSSRTPRFVFKDGKLQAVVPEESSTSFTVNRITSIEDEVSGVMKLTLPELDLEDDRTADALYEQMPDDGMESIPFPSAAHHVRRESEENDPECGKVRFDFDNRSTDYGFIEFSF